MISCLFQVVRWPPWRVYNSILQLEVGYNIQPSGISITWLNHYKSQMWIFISPLKLCYLSARTFFNDDIVLYTKKPHLFTIFFGKYCILGGLWVQSCCCELVSNSGNWFWICAWKSYGYFDFTRPFDCSFFRIYHR